MSNNYSIESAAVRFVLFAFLGAIWVSGLAQAEQSSVKALLIGVNKYEYSDLINELGGADEDAQALADTLKLLTGSQDIILLTSRTSPLPTRANIGLAIDELRNKVKPGDIVYFFFSGHGAQDANKTTYLIQYDCAAKNSDMLAFSAIKTSEILSMLNSLPAKALIMIYDTCQNDPFKIESPKKESPKGVGELAEYRLTDVQAKSLRARATPAGTPGPENTVTFQSCSPLQKSYEWVEKKRGYFSYFLELGLRGYAADEKGQITVSSLNQYLLAAVPSRVKMDNGGAVQKPYPSMVGPDAANLVLSVVRPNLILESDPPGAKVWVDDDEIKNKTTPCELFLPIDPTLESKQVSVKLDKNGCTSAFDVKVSLRARVPTKPALQKLRCPEQQGTLRIPVEPRETVVRIGENEVSSGTQMKVGRYDVAFSGPPCYQSRTISVDVTADGTFEVIGGIRQKQPIGTIQLQQKKATLPIETDPKEANLKVLSGSLQIGNDKKSVELACGEEGKVRVSLDKYISQEITVRYPPDEKPIIEPGGIIRLEPVKVTDTTPPTITILEPAELSGGKTQWTLERSCEPQ